MRNTYLAVGIFVVILVAVAFMFVRNKLPQFQAANNATPTPTLSETQNEKTTIVMGKHTPASTAVIDSTTLEKPGFIVIYDGQTNQILGKSDLLSAGTHDNVAIALSQKTTIGETLIAQVHTDTNGNGTFDEKEDEPVKNETGSPIQTQVAVTTAETSGFQIPATGLGEDDK